MSDKYILKKSENKNKKYVLINEETNKKINFG